MKVTGTGPTRAPSARPVPHQATEAFAASASEDAAAPAQAARAGALGAVSTLDALLALQETLGPLERRRRATRRAGRILDALDDLKLALLDEGSGAVPSGPALEGLKTAIGELRNETDDEALEDILEQIEIRAAVEMAKREQAGASRPGRGGDGAT